MPVWMFPLLIAVLVALVGWWGNYHLRDAIESELKADLTATLNANVTALQIWATNQMRLATELATEPAVSKVAARILEAPMSEPRSQPTMDAMMLGNYLRPRLVTMGYQIAQVVNTNLYVAATSMRIPFGGGLASPGETHTDKFGELFARGEPIIITPFKANFPVERRVAPGDARAHRNRFNAARRRGDEMLMQSRGADPAGRGQHRERRRWHWSSTPPMSFPGCFQWRIAAKLARPLHSTRPGC